MYEIFFREFLCHNFVSGLPALKPKHLKISSKNLCFPALLLCRQIYRNVFSPFSNVLLTCPLFLRRNAAATGENMGDYTACPSIRPFFLSVTLPSHILIVHRVKC